MNQTLKTVLLSVVAATALSACSAAAKYNKEGAEAIDSGSCRAVGQKDTKGNNVKFLCSASAALNSAVAKEALDSSFRVSYGSLGGGKAYTSGQNANAAGKSAEDTCQRAFINAVKRFESTATRVGGKNIRLVSYYDKKERGGNEFECHIGTWHSRVWLRGTIN